MSAAEFLALFGVVNLLTEDEAWLLIDQADNAEYCEQRTR